MSRILVWLLSSLAGLLYWGLVHGFAYAGIDHFTGPVWFGGWVLFIHWFVNRTPTPPHGGEGDKHE